MQPFRILSSFVILLTVLACSGNEEIFQPQSFDELPGHTMALVEGTVQADFSEQHFRDKGVNLVYFPGFTDGMIAVRQGRADVLFANLLMNILKPYRPLIADITYSELDYRLVVRTLVTGLDHKVLDNSEELSLSIVRGMSHKITETVTAEGLVIEIA